MRFLSRIAGDGRSVTVDVTASDGRVRESATPVTRVLFLVDHEARAFTMQVQRKRKCPRIGDTECMHASLMVAYDAFVRSDTRLAGYSFETGTRVCSDPSGIVGEEVDSVRRRHLSIRLARHVSATGAGGPWAPAADCVTRGYGRLVIGWSGVSDTACEVCDLTRTPMFGMMCCNGKAICRVCFNRVSTVIGTCPWCRRSLYFP